MSSPARFRFVEGAGLIPGVPAAVERPVERR